jgi:hypothetical protein
MTLNQYTSLAVQFKTVSNESVDFDYRIIPLEGMQAVSVGGQSFRLAGAA